MSITEILDTRPSARLVLTCFRCKRKRQVTLPAWKDAETGTRAGIIDPATGMGMHARSLSTRRAHIDKAAAEDSEANLIYRTAALWGMVCDCGLYLTAFKVAVVKGERTKTKCSARCREAVSLICRCECAGASHGIHSPIAHRRAA